MRADALTRRALLERAGGIALLGPAAVLAAGCGNGESADDVLARARERGTIRAGFANESPYGYATSGGRLVGQSPDVARAVLRRLGVPQIEGVLTTFDALIPDIVEGRFDIITAGMFITPERCREVLFSDPDYVAPQAFAVRRGNPLRLNDYRDVARMPQARLGVLMGAIEREYALALGVEADRVRGFPDPLSGIEALRLGRIDAFALTSVSIRRLVRSSDGTLELAGPFVPVIDGERKLGAGGYAFRREDRAFRDAFNRELNRLKRLRRLLPIVARYGFTRAELDPATRLTAARLCRRAP